MPRRPKREPRPKQQARAEFYDAARKDGWEPTFRGWPDSICFRTDKDGKTEVRVVEVTGSKGRRVREHQRHFMSLLTSCGIPCFTYSRDTGWQEYGKTFPTNGGI